MHVKHLAQYLTGQSKLLRYLELTVILILCVGVFTACSSTEDQRRSEAGTTIPWNQPEPWEDKPGLMSPIRW